MKKLRATFITVRIPKETFSKMHIETKTLLNLYGGGIDADKDWVFHIASGQIPRIGINRWERSVVKEGQDESTQTASY